MSLTLAVADNADGTGAVATIAGSTGSVAVWTQPVQLGGPLAASWTLAGTRSGNGTVALSLGLGTYWAYALNVSLVSTPVYFGVTQSADAVASRLQDALVARLLGLSMTGNPNARILGAINENEKIAQFPCTYCVFAGEAEVEESGLTTRDTIVYHFRLRIVDRCSPDDGANRKMYQLWKQQYMRALRNQRFLAVPESLTTRVRPRKSQFLAGGTWQLWSMELDVECVARETRG